MVILSTETTTNPSTLVGHRYKPSPHAAPAPVSSPRYKSSYKPQMLSKFLQGLNDLKNYRNGKPIQVDGESLSVPAIVAVSRYNASVTLDTTPGVTDKMAKSRDVITGKVTDGTSVYGVSTGFGGSATTRTDKPLTLGYALLQHQHAGVLPSSQHQGEALPLLDPLSSLSMPEAWVRGAILVRMNSLIRGHSGVKMELIKKMNEFLAHDIIPLVPLRGSISASGDLSPLSYIAGAIIGNPAIQVYTGPRTSGPRALVSSKKALEDNGIVPYILGAKEPLGILNGTAFSASVGSLALSDAIQLAILSQVCTAMGTEALAGTRANYDPFIHDVCRPHPGQVEAAKVIYDLLEGSKLATTEDTEVHISEDDGTLRQDRYPLRTAPQFIGPQIEDLLASLASITQECNSTTDNPLIDGQTGHVHHGGNFQAMAVTNAMEKTRLALHHLGKLLFSQLTELLNPTMNRGLPPSLAATDPSLDYHCKGVDIASASYMAELGYLAHPVSTHIQSAEMHNQAINSMALVSARMTIQSLQVLSLLTSNYLYVLCQALDLRAMYMELIAGIEKIVAEELATTFGSLMSDMSIKQLVIEINQSFLPILDQTSEMDAPDRMQKVAAASSTILVDYLTTQVASASAFSSIPAFRTRVASQSADLLIALRSDYLFGFRGPAPASKFLNKTRPMYEFIRIALNIQMHGKENFSKFANGLGVDDHSIGQNISLIHEAIQDGRMTGVLLDLFDH